MRIHLFWFIVKRQLKQVRTGWYNDCMIYRYIFKQDLDHAVYTDIGSCWVTSHIPVCISPLSYPLHSSAPLTHSQFLLQHSERHRAADISLYVARTTVISLWDEWNERSTRAVQRCAACVGNRAAWLCQLSVCLLAVLVSSCSVTVWHWDSARMQVTDLFKKCSANTDVSYTTEIRFRPH